MCYSPIRPTPASEPMTIPAISPPDRSFDDATVVAVDGAVWLVSPEAVVFSVVVAEFSVFSAVVAVFSAVVAVVPEVAASPEAVVLPAGVVVSVVAVFPEVAASPEPVVLPGPVGTVAE